MRTHFYRSLTSSAVALLLLLSLRGSALADAASALRCQQTINRELAKFVKSKSRILRVCKEKSIKKGVPSNPVECPLPAQDDQINAAAQKMLAKIAVSCGGANGICNASDVGADADEPLAAIGWDIGTCPDLSGQGCTNAIADCNDIGTCVACIGNEAVNRANELYYDLLTPAEFTTGSAVNDCQVAIGKAATKFLQTKSKLLKSCWANVLAAKPGFTSPPGCPDTDAASAAKIAQAEQKKIAAICKGCGAGGDENEDGICDLTPGFGAAEIGFEPDCPDVTVPGAPTTCFATVATLDELIACVDCVTEFEVDCSASVAVPSETTYPVECSAVP
jgi:hypothetical protein